MRLRAWVFLRHADDVRDEARSVYNADPHDVAVSLVSFLTDDRGGNDLDLSIMSDLSCKVIQANNLRSAESIL